MSCWRRRRQVLVVVAGLCASVALAADTPLDAAAERQRLQTEEQAVRATFAAEEAACRERFVVTSCIDDARRRERAALASLRQQTLKLDDADRQRRAALRSEEVARKQAAAAAAASAAAAAQAAEVEKAGIAGRAVNAAPGPAAAPTSSSSAAGDAATQPTAVTTLPPSVPLPPLPPPRVSGPDPEAAREAAERVVAAERRRQAALVEQARIAEREAQRQAGGKASPPLPIPASAARP